MATVIGTDGDDYLRGTGGDTIYAEAGDDTLEGSISILGDALYGGEGDDTYLVPVGSFVRIGDGWGYDTVRFDADIEAADLIFTTRMEQGVERLRVTATTSSASEHGITVDITTVSVSARRDIDTFFLADGTEVSWGSTIFGTDEAERYDGTDRSDYLEGGDGSDTLIGGHGPDRLVAGTMNSDDGDDRLEGGAGDDRLVTGFGRDTLLGGEGTDTLEVLGSGGFQTRNVPLDIDLSRMTTDGSWFGDLFLGSIERLDVHGQGRDDYIVGGDLADTITGGFGDDTLAGGDGSDIVFGGTGDDVLYGDGFA